MSKEFKAGDKVYYPDRGTRVFQLDGRKSTGNYTTVYLYKYLIATGDYVCETFTPEGFRDSEDDIPKLFHATPENHTLLEQLYGVEFEEPPIMELPE